MSLSELKKKEELKRERHWNPRRRWNAIRAMIAWAEARSKSPRNSRRSCLRRQARLLASLASARRPAPQ